MQNMICIFAKKEEIKNKMTKNNIDTPKKVLLTQGIYKVYQDQYDALEHIAKEFGQSMKDQFFPRGQRYAIPTSDGFIDSLLIAHYKNQPIPNGRTFVLPTELSHLRSLSYKNEEEFSALHFPEHCDSLEELNLIWTKVQEVTLPKNLPRLKKVFVQVVPVLRELHLETSHNLERITVIGSPTLRVYFPETMKFDVTIEYFAYDGKTYLGNDAIKELSKKKLAN